MPKGKKQQKGSKVSDQNQEGQQQSGNQQQQQKGSPNASSTQRQ